MKVLVTGGSGFIGRALVYRLAETGIPVTAGVRRPGVTFPRDIKVIDMGDLGSENRGRRPVDVLDVVDAVVHTAARVHVMKGSASSAREFRRVNVTGTLNLAKAAAEAGVRRFVFISSVKANGENTGLQEPYHEQCRPDPVDPYGVSKLEAEQGLWEISRQTGMEVVIIRPPLVYGPGVGGNFLRLLRAIDRGIPLPFLRVENRRSLVSLENLIMFILACLQHNAAAGELFFVSDDEDVSTADLVARLAAAMNKPRRLFPVPMALSHAVLTAAGREDLWLRLFGSLRVSCAKAKRLLAWTPSISLNQGIERVARWYLEEGRAS